MSFFQKSLFLPKVQKIMTKKNYQFSLIVFILFSRIVYSPEELLPPIANSPEELLPPIVNSPEELLPPIVNSPEELLPPIANSPEELLPPIANSPEELLPPISVGVVNEVTTSIKANSPNVVANFFII
jgi:hypothetical protein